MKDTEDSTEQGSRRLRVLLIISVAAVVVALGAAIFFFVQYRAESNKNASTSQKKGPTYDDVIKKVGQLYDAPSGERPSVAQVGDKGKLAGQQFFDNAKKGDYVLVYPKAKMAVIYRYTNNKIINIGPVGTQ